MWSQEVGRFDVLVQSNVQGPHEEERIFGTLDSSVGRQLGLCWSSNRSDSVSSKYDWSFPALVPTPRRKSSR